MPEARQVLGLGFRDSWFRDQGLRVHSEGQVLRAYLLTARTLLPYL